MALTVSTVATSNSVVAGATLSVTGVTAAIGDFLVLACAADNAGAAGVSSTSAAITDAAGNTWTRQSVNTQTAGVAADGTTLSIWTAPVTSALTGATITINYSPNTTARAAALAKAVPDSGQTVEIVAAGAGATGNGTTQSAGSVSVTGGQTIVGWVAAEYDANLTADADTTNGSWSTAQRATANGGSQNTSQHIHGQFKTVTATGTQDFATTLGAARDFAANYLIIRAVTTAALAATEAADVAAFADVLFAALAATEAADVALFGGDLHDPLDGTFAATEEGDTATFTGDVLDAADDGTASSIRILVRIDWPHGPVTRLWDGGGPYVDLEGEVWTGAGNITSGLDDLEGAFNGEAWTLALGISGVPSDAADMAWKDYSLNLVIGAVVRILIQPCDELDQPVGEPSVHFTGDIDNMLFEDAAEAGAVTSTITIEVTNRFSMRRLAAGSVLSDPDQKARSAVINPGAPPDRFAEFVSLMADKTVVWPRFTA